MSDTSEKNQDEDLELLENLDFLMNMEIAESEKDWDSIAGEWNKEDKENETE